MLTAFYIYLGLTHVLIPIIIITIILIVLLSARKDDPTLKLDTTEKRRLCLQLSIYLVSSFLLGAILTPVVCIIIYGLYGFRNSE